MPKTANFKVRNFPACHNYRAAIGGKVTDVSLYAPEDCPGSFFMGIVGAPEIRPGSNGFAICYQFGNVPVLSVVDLADRDNVHRTVLYRIPSGIEGRFELYGEGLSFL